MFVTCESIFRSRKCNSNDVMFASFIFYVKYLHDWKMVKITEMNWMSPVIYFWYHLTTWKNVWKCVRLCENYFSIYRRYGIKEQKKCVGVSVSSFSKLSRIRRNELIVPLLEPKECTGDYFPFLHGSQCSRNLLSWIEKRNDIKNPHSIFRLYSILLRLSSNIETRVLLPIVNQAAFTRNILSSFFFK